MGRFAELRKLREQWDAVRQAGPAGSVQSARCVFVSGPSGVGKTRLVGELTTRTPDAVLFHAVSTSHSPAQQLAAFAEAAALSPLAGAHRFGDLLAPDWHGAFTMLAQAMAGSSPAIVVLDRADAISGDGADRDSFADQLWAAWQRDLANRPILLVLIGQDLGPVIDARPNSVSASHIALGMFNPRELTSVLDLPPADALDAYLATGGRPEIAAGWPTGSGVMRALDVMVRRSPATFDIAGELDLARRLGPDSQARLIVGAAGAGCHSRSALVRASGLPVASLDRGLKELIAAGLMTVERPMSLAASREARYRVTDPYLRLWLAAIAPQRENIARGDIDAVMAGMSQLWPTWRRRAIDHVIRAAMHRLAVNGALPGTGAVGAFWTRSESVRIALIGLDRVDDPTAVTFVGAIKWDEQETFSHYDLGELIAARAHVPGVTDGTPLVAVSLSGSAVGDAVAAMLGPGELITAWGE